MKYVGETAEGLELASKLASMGVAVKVTRIEKDGWNDMEGQNYTVTIKATAPQGKLLAYNGRKSLLFKFTTNSTWLEDEEEYGDETEEELIHSMVENACL